MRSALMVCLASALVVLGGCCGSGGCGVARGRTMRAPAGYGSARTASRVVYERSPSVAVREAARPAPTYVRTARSFTPPTAPALPAEKTACAPVADPCCPGGNCAIPSLDDCCPGGSCAIPSLDSLFNPCK